MIYIVLLRGINIGGRKVKSADLKRCFNEAGFQKAQTVLATGNVIIESGKKPKDLRLQIEKMLLDAFHFPVRICLVDAGKLNGIIQNYPFEKEEAFHRYVIFRDVPAEVDNSKLDKDIEKVKSDNKVIYWQVRKGRTLDSDFAKAFAKKSAKNFSTTRNLNTLEKIQKKINEKR